MSTQLQNTAGSQIATKESGTLHEWLASADVRKMLERVATKYLTSDRMLGLVVAEIKRNPKLRECTTGSIINTMAQAHELGLPISSLQGKAYPVPFKNKDKKTGKYEKECQLIIGYKGMIDLAMRSGKVISVTPYAIYENDLIDYQYGTSSFLNHKPTLKGRGKLLATYAKVVYANGREECRIATMEDIEAARMKSPTGKDGYGAWGSDYGSMGLKTAVRITCKYLNLSPELNKAITLEETAGTGAQAGLMQHHNIIDGDTGEIIEDAPEESQAKKIANELKADEPKKDKDGKVDPSDIPFGDVAAK